MEQGVYLLPNLNLDMQHQMQIGNHYLEQFDLKNKKRSM